MATKTIKNKTNACRLLIISELMIPKFAASEIYCPYRASPLQKGRLILHLLYLQHNNNNNNNNNFFKH